MPHSRPTRRPRSRIARSLAVVAVSWAMCAFGVGVSAQTAHDEAASRRTASAPRSDLLVLAAASLADVLPAIADAWSATEGVAVRFSFDATSRLAPQIVGGAPADVFLSADSEWTTWLVEQGAAAHDAPRAVARNELVVVVPRGHPRPPTVAELARLGAVAIAGDNVPAGRYARAALAWGGAAESDRFRIITGGSVRGVLEWVARGEAPAGVVYRTDAAVEPAVDVAFTFPADAHAPIRYWATPLLASARPVEARAFVDHLTSSDAGRRFAAAGFGVDDLAAPGARPASPQASPGPSAPVLPSVGSAIRLSLIVALLATLAGLGPAIGLGWLLARHDFRGKTLLSTVVLAPLVIPPVVTGFLLLSVLGTRSPLGSALAGLGLPVPFTIIGAAIAALVVGMPLYVLSIRGAFEAVDPQYEELSWTLGIPPRRTFLRISLPLALPGIAAGAILAFARSLGEFGATIVLAGNVEAETRTIALAVYTLLESPSGREATWTLVGASVALSLLALIGYETLSRRQRRRLERDHAH